MTASVEIRMVRLPEAADLPLPRQATPGSSGFDLRARIDGTLSLAPGDRALVPSGIALALPPGYEGQIRPRSGLAVRHGLTDQRQTDTQD